MNFVGIPNLVYELPLAHELKQFYSGYAYKIAKDIYNRIYLRTVCAEAQNWRCCFCFIQTTIPSGSKTRKTDATLEHVIPKSRGGKDEFANSVMSCSRCNNSRGTKYICEEQLVC